MKSFVTLAAAGVLWLMSASAALAQPTFTGNVPTDFTGFLGDTQVVNFLDPSGPTGDVGVPGPSPPCADVPGGTGWDINAISLFYDRTTDTLYVGVDFLNIAGDADNDGGEGTTSPGALCRGAIDFPDLGDSESIALALDTNLDGLRDLVVGVSGFVDVSGFTAALPSAQPPAPLALSFGAADPAHTGVLFGPIGPGAPDFEFTIPNFSTVPGFTGPDPVTGSFIFTIGAFAGSFADSGYGEDICQQTLVSLICEDFENADTGANSVDISVAQPYANGGILIDGTGCLAFPGVFYAQQADDPSLDDSIPCSGVNFIKTREFAGDLSSSAGFINFHFVNPLDGVTPLGATTAGLCFIDVEASGNGAVNGSYFNAFDSGNSLIASTPVPWGGGNGEQQSLVHNSAAGDIASVQADLGYDDTCFDSCAVDLICANLNPLSLPAAPITSGSFQARAGDTITITVRRHNEGRRVVEAELIVVNPETGETVQPVINRQSVRLPGTTAEGREHTRPIQIMDGLPPGIYAVQLSLRPVDPTSNALRLYFCTVEMQIVQP